jgi:hypothetical protein
VAASRTRATSFGGPPTLTRRPEERLLDIKRVVGIPADATDTDDMVAIVRANEAVRGQGVCKEMLINPSRPVRRMLVAGLGLMFIQQAMGVNWVVMYS